VTHHAPRRADSCTAPILAPRAVRRLLPLLPRSGPVTVQRLSRGVRVVAQGDHAGEERAEGSGRCGGLERVVGRRCDVTGLMGVMGVMGVMYRSDRSRAVAT
jgi:hypothetical protein